MEGISKITYKGKEIIFVDYTVTQGDKEKIIQMIKAWGELFCKYPPKSALALTNLADFQFDKEVLNVFKESQNKCNQYEKKIAVFGMKPIHKAAYNFLLAVTIDRFTKVFNSEEEAKEWLVKD